MSRAAGRERCAWVPEADALYAAYHDTEWGVPEFDDRALYEKLVLDGFQAGLSWLTILRKRENFRRAFDGFEPQRIARYTPRKVDALLKDAGIVRHRGKIEGAIQNARAWLAIMDGRGFSAFLWDFVDGRPVQNAWPSIAEIPAETEMSRKLSKALKEKGFRFCGPTIVYAFAQAVGMVNDHTTGCFRHGPVSRMGGRGPRARNTDRR